MSSALDNILLIESLKVLDRYYSDPKMEEVAINRPGEVYIKYSGGEWEAIQDPEITYEYVMAVCRILANITEQNFDKDDLPILAGTLPGGHRFQAVVGPNVRYDNSDTAGIAVCIRCFRQGKEIGLDNFGLKKGEALERTGKSHKRIKYSDNAYEDLIMAVENGEAVLVSGATSSGKTTFLNALVEYMPLSRRIITVEDTREVILNHPNRVHFVVSRTAATNQVTYPHILDCVVRLTPDAIICGEISIVNSKSIYRLMTTGHCNFMATIHAETPEMALRAFWQNLTQSDPNLDAEAAISILARSFGRIIQIDRSDGQRVVTNVDIPDFIEDTLRDELENPSPPITNPETTQAELEDQPY